MPRAPLLAVVLLLARARAAAAQEPPAPGAAPPAQEPPAPDAAPPAQPAMEPPQILHFVQAAYPRDAALAGLEARVGLEVVVSPDGATGDVQVVAPGGPGF